MSDRGEVVEWVEATENIIIIEECVLSNGGSSSVLQVSQPAGTPMQKLLDTMVQGEEAEFDDGFYCEECRALFQQQSSVSLSGPSFILDSPSGMGAAQRALLTLPHGLMIGRSSIPYKGLGVMNQGPAVTPGMHFGPYEGEETSREEAVASRFSWEIYKGNDEYNYIDAARETHSNWMRYVNCARSREETNLLAVQYKGSILFHCCRTIQPGDELVLWPSPGLVGRLSQAWGPLWLRKRSPCEAEPGTAAQMFLCPQCPLSFTTETYRQRHVEHFHTQPKRERSTPDTENAEPPDRPPAPGVAPPHPLDSLLVVDAFEAKTCPECGKIFKHTHHLKRHMLSVHSNQRPYCCPQCRRSFSQASGLLRHQLVHNKVLPADAPSGHNQRCGPEAEAETKTGGSPQIPSLPDGGGIGELAGTEDASVAERSPGTESGPLEEGGGPGERPPTCVQCEKSFSSARYLEKHRTRVHGALRPYVCTLCRKTFSQHHDLARHLQTHQRSAGPAAATQEPSSAESSDDSPHRDPDHLDFSAEPLPPEVPEPPKEPAYRRPQRLGARSKISAITKLIAPKPRTPVNKRKAPSRARRAPEAEGSASARGPAGALAGGGQEQEQAEALEEHVCSAAPHTCSVCGSTFKKAGFLRRHERTVHAGTESYACSVCGKAFSKRFNLKQHQKTRNCGRHHCTADIFSCAFCPFSFTLLSYLRKHLRRHHRTQHATLSHADGPEPRGGEEEEEAGDGPHVCPKCGKKYASGNAAHRCGPQALLYLCTDCGKGFTKHSSLKQHQRTHSGLRPHCCPHCLKSFVHMGQLNVHLRTHTGEKPYLCTHCGDSFRQSGDLKRHERKHTGVRPHSCPECFKSFSRPQSLRAHLLLHRGQRMFKCDECGKSFSRNYHLRRHQHKMHLPTGGEASHL